MARKQKDFSKGKIYIIRNTENDKVYIGSTCQTLAQRMAQHRSRARCNDNSLTLYASMFDIGIDKFYIELLEDCPCERNEQLLQREGFYIRQYDCINNGYNNMMQGEPKTKHEIDKTYRVRNKSKCQERHKKYYNNKKDNILQYQQEYRQNNKETISEYKQTYKNANKEKIAQDLKERYEAQKEERLKKMKAYYEANKEKIAKYKKEWAERKKAEHQGLTNTA